MALMLAWLGLGSLLPQVLSGVEVTGLGELGGNLAQRSALARYRVGARPQIQGSE